MRKKGMMIMVWLLSIVPVLAQEVVEEGVYCGPVRIWSYYDVWQQDYFVAERVKIQLSDTVYWLIPTIDRYWQECGRVPIDRERGGQVRILWCDTLSGWIIFKVNIFRPFVDSVDLEEEAGKECLYWLVFNHSELWALNWKTAVPLHLVEGADRLVADPWKVTPREGQWEVQCRLGLQQGYQVVILCETSEGRLAVCYR